MPLSVRLPDLKHWKSQVKCQASCPVATDAGRYVQLIAEGRDTRTGTLLAVEGTVAFGAASLALLRFTGGPLAAAVLLSVSVVTWAVMPVVAAIHRLRRSDI